MVETDLEIGIPPASMVRPVDADFFVVNVANAGFVVSGYNGKHFGGDASGTSCPL